MPLLKLIHKDLHFSLLTQRLKAGRLSFHPTMKRIHLHLRRLTLVGSDKIGNSNVLLQGISANLACKSFPSVLRLWQTNQILYVWTPIVLLKVTDENQNDHRFVWSRIAVMSTAAKGRCACCLFHKIGSEPFQSTLAPGHLVLMVSSSGPPPRQSWPGWTVKRIGASCRARPS